MIIIATKWTHQHEDGTSILGFLNENEDEYILIMHTLEHDDQEDKLDINSHYLEINDQSIGSYDAVERVEFSSNEIRLKINSSAREKMGVEMVTIKLDQNFDLIAEILRNEMKIEDIEYAR